MNKRDQAVELSNQTVTGARGALVLAALFSGSLLLTGCSGDSDDAQQAEAEQSTMAVAQPKPAEAPSLPEKAETKVEEVEKAVKETATEVAKEVEQKAEEVEKALAETTAAATEKAEAMVADSEPAGVNGQEAYATCAGCHGGAGEGGVGPQLNNQAPADIVAKLEKYKAGEQMGPMTGMMAPMASGLSTETMQAIADFIGAK